MRNSIKFFGAFSVSAVLAISAGCTQPASDYPAVSPTQVSVAHESPLDEFLNAVWGTDLSFEERTRRADEQHARWVELVTQCMHEQGFNFDINNQPAGTYTNFNIVVMPDDAFALDDPNWVNQWGYGIMSSPVQSESNGSTRDEGPVLSDAELDAFSRALHGRGFLPPLGEWDENNCMSWSLEKLAEETPEGLARQEEFALLFEAIDQMEETFRQEVSNADIRWSQCMADAGQPGFQRQWEAQDSIRQESFRVLNRGGGLAPQSGSDEELLRLREIELALQDLDCRVSTGFATEQNANRLAFETQFVEANRPFLEELRAAAEQRVS